MQRLHSYRYCVRMYAIKTTTKLDLEGRCLNVLFLGMSEIFSIHFAWVIKCV